MRTQQRQKKEKDTAIFHYDETSGFCQGKLRTSYRPKKTRGVFRDRRDSGYVGELADFAVRKPALFSLDMLSRACLGKQTRFVVIVPSLS